MSRLSWIGLFGLVLIGGLLVLFVVANRRLYFMGFPYNGDGKFVDRGIRTTDERYSIDLGYIDVNREGVYKFTIGMLPPTIWSAGFVAEDPSFEQSQCTIRIVLQNQNGTLFDKAAPAKHWGWSTTARPMERFAYQTEGDGVKSATVAEAVMGTCFRPAIGTRYTVTYEVLVPAETPFLVRAALFGESGIQGHKMRVELTKAPPAE